jgi:hypothetical protein
MDETATGKGDDPSPAMGSERSEAIEVALLMALRAPANMRTARAATINFLSLFTVQPPIQAHYTPGGLTGEPHSNRELIGCSNALLTTG